MVNLVNIWESENESVKEYSVAKNLSAIQETQIWSLGQEDPLENEIATHSSTVG